MKKDQVFFLSTLLAWSFSLGFGAWLITSPLRFSVKSGFYVLGIIWLVSTLIISILQCRIIERCSYILWFLATAGALGIGSYGAAFAYMLAHFPIINWQSDLFIIDWLYWPLVMFLLTAIGGLLGGLIAGLLKRWAVGEGSFLRWTAVSAGTWALSFGLIGLLFQIIDYPDYFYLDNFRQTPIIIKGALIGVIAGAVQGWILGGFLQRNAYFQQQVMPESPSSLT